MAGSAGERHHHLAQGRPVPGGRPARLGGRLEWHDPRHRGWRAELAAAGDRRRYDLRAVQFLEDGRRGWAVGEDGTILATADGGQSWQRQASGTSTWLRAVQFLEDGRRGWAVGEDGTILATADGGQSWQPQASGTPAPGSGRSSSWRTAGAAGRSARMARSSPPQMAGRAGSRRRAAPAPGSGPSSFWRTAGAAGRSAWVARSSPPRMAGRAGSRRRAAPASGS